MHSIMTEIERIRKRRSKNVSYAANNYVSGNLKRPMTKEEIFKVARNLEAEMLYLEGYISLEEKETYTGYSENNKGIICKCCKMPITDYVIWNDFVVYSNGMFNFVRIPLSKDNVVEKFNRLRKECEQAGEPSYKSYILGELDSESNIIKTIQKSYYLTDEPMILGLTCPNCGAKLEDIQHYVHSEAI